MKKRRMKVGCQNTLADLERLKMVAMPLIVRTSVVLGGKHRSTIHVMFEWAGKRVLDYWPGNGTTYCRRTNEKDKVADCFAALEMARRLKEDHFEMPS